MMRKSQNIKTFIHNNFIRAQTMTKTQHKSFGIFMKNFFHYFFDKKLRGKI